VPPSPNEELPVLGAVFKTLCANCGGLFRNGDGHVCA
jgi:hypothetical protein